MKRPGFLTASRVFSAALAFAVMVAGGVGTYARADTASGAPSQNMRLVGSNDLQARSAYQPTLHKYPGGRYILFIGHHPLGLQGEGQLPNAQRLPSFNPLTGENELNGTSIVDVTDPRNPKYLFHLPVSDGTSSSFDRPPPLAHCESRDHRAVLSILIGSNESIMRSVIRRDITNWKARECSRFPL